jgi:hypothetical protein
MDIPLPQSLDFEPSQLPRSWVFLTMFETWRSAGVAESRSEESLDSYIKGEVHHYFLSLIIITLIKTLLSL